MPRPTVFHQDDHIRIGGHDFLQQVVMMGILHGNVRKKNSN
jgi:hypothetical protein